VLPYTLTVRRSKTGQPIRWMDGDERKQLR
jgi:hypothetical protein